MAQSDWDPKSDAARQDQRAVYDDMRQRCPVAHSDFLNWSLFRHEDVTKVLHDHETYSNKVSSRTSVPNGMDPPEHTEFRRIIERYFEPEYMEAFEPVCRHIASELTQQLLRRDDIEIIADFAKAYSVRIQCAFLGWPDDMHDSLRDWMQLNHAATLAQDRPKMDEIARQFEGYISGLLEERRGAGEAAPDDVTTDLMRAQVFGRLIRDDEIISILRNWTAGEVGSIAASVGILTHFLAMHPELQRQLRDDPSLLPEAIKEILRMDGPLVANRRVTTRPVEIRGREIAAGERISINWVSANRDETVFEDATSFRFGRDQRNNLLYGAGIHVCPGAPLARLEMRVVMEELLKSTELIEPHPTKSPTRAVYPAGGFESVPLRIR